MRRLIIMLFVACLYAEPIGVSFPEAFNSWARLANARAEHPGTIDAREYLAWQRVKAEWRVLERGMDRFYGGGR